MKKYLSILLVLASISVRAQIIRTIAGNGTSGYTGDGGSAIQAELNYPLVSIADTLGNVYISDSHNCVVRKVDSNGNISTFAGTGVQGYSGDGGLATAAQLSSPGGIAIDDSGNVYIADAGNAVVRKISLGGIINTIAGNGTPGYSGDGGSAIAAQLTVPIGVAVDHGGSVYIVDMQSHCLRKVDRSGIIYTIIPSSELIFPTSVVVDSKNNLFVCNTAVQKILKSDTLGNYVVYAGTGVAGFGGDGGSATAAKFNFPNYSANGPIITIGIDKNDNIYIPDCFNQRVRKIDTSGIIHTIAGTGAIGFSGDGGSATLAKMLDPAGVNVDALGNIFVADWGNQRMREISSVNLVCQSIQRDELVLYPNPNDGVFTIRFDKPGTIEISNLEGQLFDKFILGPIDSVNCKGLVGGIYIYRFISAHGTVRTGKLEVIK